MKKIISKLIETTNKLDAIGYKKASDRLDLLIKKISESYADLCDLCHGTKKVKYIQDVNDIPDDEFAFIFNLTKPRPCPKCSLKKEVTSSTQLSDTYFPETESFDDICSKCGGKKELKILPDLPLDELLNLKWSDAPVVQCDACNGSGLSNNFDIG